MNMHQVMWHLHRLADSSILGEDEIAALKAACLVLGNVGRAYEFKHKDTSPAILCAMILAKADHE